MKRGVFLLILTAGLLSLLFGTIMPIMYFTYRNRLQQAESDLLDAQMQLQNANANAAGPNANFPFPNVKRRPGIQAVPGIAIPEMSYRSAVATAQDLLSRDPNRARAILVDRSECPSELHDFGWYWAMGHLPRVERHLFKGNCHAAVLSKDGKTLAVQTGERQEGNLRIVVVDLGPDKRPAITFAEVSSNFTLAPDGSHLAVFKGGGEICLYTVGNRSVPPVTLHDAGMEIGFTADGSKLVSASYGQPGNLTLWQVDAGKEISRFPIQGDWIKLTDDRSALVALTYARDDAPGKVTRYDVATGGIQQTVPIALDGRTTFTTPNALSNDGASLATVRKDKDQDRLEMWDLQKGELRWAVALPPNGLDNLVLQLAYAPAGRYLASVGCEDDIRLWDAATGACHKWFSNGQRGRSEFVPRPEFLVWQPDGKAIVVDTSVGPTAWRPGVAADRLVWTTPQASGGIQALSSDGHFLAATTTTGTVQIWDVVDRRMVATIPAGKSRVSNLQFSSDNVQLAVVHEDWTISLVDVATGKSHADLPAPANGLEAIAFTQDAPYFTTLDKDGIVRFHDSANGRELKSGGPYLGAALSPNGFCVAHFENNGQTVVVTHVQALTEVARFEGNHAFSSLGFMNDSEVVIANDDFGCFSSWNLRTRTRLLDATDQLPHAPLLLLKGDYHWATSANGNTIAGLSDFGEVRVYDGTTGTLRFTTHSLALRNPGLINGNMRPEPDAPSGNHLDRFALSRDGRFLLIVGREAPQDQPFCQILDGLTGDEVRPVPLPSGPLQDLMFSADGTAFAVVQPKGPITIWKLP